MALLDDVKDVLRVNGDDRDSEINDLITAAISDLALAGVSPDKAKDETDPLIRRAILLFAKANYGWDNPEADRFQKSYDLLKSSLTMAGDYRAEG